MVAVHPLTGSTFCQKSNIDLSTTYRIASPKACAASFSFMALEISEDDEVVVVSVSVFSSSLLLSSSLLSSTPAVGNGVAAGVFFFVFFFFLWLLFFLVKGDPVPVLVVLVVLAVAVVLWAPPRKDSTTTAVVVVWGRRGARMRLLSPVTVLGMFHGVVVPPIPPASTPVDVEQETTHPTITMKPHHDEKEEDDIELFRVTTGGSCTVTNNDHDEDPVRNRSSGCTSNGTNMTNNGSDDAYNRHTREIEDAIIQEEQRIAKLEAYRSTLEESE